MCVATVEHLSCVHLGRIACGNFCVVEVPTKTFFCVVEVPTKTFFCVVEVQNQNVLEFKNNLCNKGVNETLFIYK